jgi:hypothetical protein
VPDHDILGAHKHLLHQKSNDPLSLLDGRVRGSIPQPSQETLEALNKFEAGLLVEQLRL